MTYTDRNEFLEKFREQQGLSFNFNTSQNYDINKSKISNLSEGEGRWEYLYQLEQLKKIKLEKLRKQKEEIEYEKDFKECTFMPKLNDYKGNVYSRLSQNLSSANSSHINSSHIVNKSKIDTLGKAIYQYIKII